jgi:hypothetical protein
MKQMKVVVINFSGNMGKTTLSGHMLQPRMNNAPIFSIETINSNGTADGLELEQMRAKRFGDLDEKMLMLDNAIVDVGSSNVEEYMKQMQQYSGSHEEIDFFIVPALKERKQQADTINTIMALSRVGVPRKKIRLIFNKVDLDDTIEEEFASLFGLAELHKNFIINPDAVIYYSEVFEKLKSVGKSLGDITKDETDYRELMRSSSDPDEKEYCRKMVQLKRLATSANNNLDTAFKALFK